MLKRIVFSAVCLCFLGLTARAMHIFKPMPADIKTDEITDVLHDRHDWQGHVEKVTKEKLIAALKHSRFANTSPSEVYDSEKFPYDPKLVNYDGSFATRDGRVFKWKLFRKNVFEVTDSQGRMGWYILETDFVAAKP
ncbi:MAG: hypothetical protein WCT04_15170 [Planctomycetota bacterium]